MEGLLAAVVLLIVIKLLFGSNSDRYAYQGKRERGSQHSRPRADSMSGNDYEYHDAHQPGSAFSPLLLLLLMAALFALLQLWLSSG